MAAGRELPHKLLHYEWFAASTDDVRSRRGDGSPPERCVHRIVEVRVAHKTCDGAGLVLARVDEGVKELVFVAEDGVVDAGGFRLTTGDALRVSLIRR
ncbi:hypothetical protein [Tsukamurella spumae]|uniref:Uncharacterized protein n=1 Tax=Tsukamurella spumae TaxID=44753 RepID=A0A846X6Q3_9ACTN|nr:hypothetical protein [Tsukamurella spumae]NKY19450.1 hypothetical protein [Tsukamurella spumae]